MAPGPCRPSTHSGARPLDQDRPAPDATRPPTPPGIRRQLGATRDAVVGLLRAHVELARAEIDEIKTEVGRVAALGGVALACVLLLAILLPIGTILFLGELVFGSIGWGLLHGTLFLVAVAVTAVLVAIRVAGLRADIVVAAVIGLVVAIVLALSLPNAAWRAVGDAAALGDPSSRALLVGALLVGAVVALAGLALGIRAGGAGNIAAGLIGGLILGALVGAFSAITFDLRAGAAVGATIGLLAWPALMAARTGRQGIDLDALKARFWPQATVDTTRETIEWAKAKNPRGPRS